MMSGTKVIIAGSRQLTDVRLVAEAVRRSGFQISEVVSGAARGIDTAGEAWAAANGIPVRRFPADWARHGRAAGPRRNTTMVGYVRPHGGALIAVWNGESRGTQHIITHARQQGIAVFVMRVEP